MRRVRAGILDLEPTPEVIAVTPPGDRGPDAAVTEALAESFAKAGHRVVLVRTDESISRGLEVEERGLAEALLHERLNVLEMLQPSVDPLLSLLPWGFNSQSRELLSPTASGPCLHRWSTPVTSWSFRRLGSTVPKERPSSAPPTWVWWSSPLDAHPRDRSRRSHSCVLEPQPAGCTGGQLAEAGSPSTSSHVGTSAESGDHESETRQAAARAPR